MLGVQKALIYILSFPFLFSFIQLKHVKSILSISVAVTFLSLLSLAHVWVFSYIS